MRLLFLHACEIKLRGGLGVRLESSIHTQSEVGPPLTHTRQVDIHNWLYNCCRLVWYSTNWLSAHFLHSLKFSWNLALCNTSKSGDMTSAWWWNLLVKLSVNYSTSKHCYVVATDWPIVPVLGGKVINFSWLWSHPTFLLVFKWMDCCMMQR